MQNHTSPLASQLLDDLPRRVDRNRKADSARLGHFERVDSDDLARLRAARIRCGIFVDISAARETLVNSRLFLNQSTMHYSSVGHEG